MISERLSMTRVVAVVIAVVLAGRVAQIQLFDQSLGEQTLNPFTNGAWVDPSTRRADIVSSDGRILAHSEWAENGWVRQYPAGSAFAHMVGWVGPGGGAGGVERAFADALVSGRARHPSPDDSAPEPLRVTIDASLQDVAANALDGRTGAIVALEPDTGAVRALVSGPSFDPERLTDSHSVQGQTAAEVAYDELDAASDRPLVSRTLDTWPAGSILKPFWFAGALEDGSVDSGSTFTATQSWSFEGHSVENFDGAVCGGTLLDVLALSCNTAAAEVASRLGPEGLRAAADDFGFDQVVPFELSSLKSTFPDAANMQDAEVLLSSALGQHDVRVNPLHIAAAYSAFATDGDIPRPVIEEGTDPETWIEGVASTATLVTIRDALREAVASGTATRAGVSGADVAAKTGTTDGGRYAWTVAFTNDLVVVVMLDGGTAGGLTGGVHAAPIAGEVLAAGVQEDL